MRDMKKDLIVSVIMIAVMAGVILMPWQAYYVIGALAGVGVLTLNRHTTRGDLKK